MFETIKNIFSRSKTKRDGPAPGVISFGGYNPPVRGTRQLLDVYSQSPWFRAVVNKIGKGVGNTNWRLYAGKNSSGKAIELPHVQTLSADVRHERVKFLLDQNEVTEITSHPLLDLLATGNEQLLGSTVIQLTNQYIDLVGEAFWLLERSRVGMPVAIWPLSPEWIKKFPTAKDPFYQVTNRSGFVADIPVTEMLIFKEPDPVDPYGRGSGIGKSLGDEIEIDEYTSKHVKTFFYNRARPDIIISGDSLGRDDTKRLEQKWLERHQGFWNAFKPVFLSRKVDIKELTQTFDNLQLTDLRKNERDIFIQVYGIPPEKLGVISQSKKSTIIAGDLYWTKDVIKPRMEHIRNTIQRNLVPQFDSRLILDFDSPVIQDKEHQFRIMNSAKFAFTVNDFRTVAGIPRIDKFGDALVLPLNSTIVDSITGEVLVETKNTPKQPGSNSADSTPPNSGKELMSDATRWMDPTPIAEVSDEDGFVENSFSGLKNKTKDKILLELPKIAEKIEEEYSRRLKEKEDAL